MNNKNLVYSDVVIVTDLAGKTYPAVVDGVASNGTVLVIAFPSYMRGHRIVRFIPEERVHNAIWTFTGYRRRPC